jgi:hypothetical protein
MDEEKKPFPIELFVILIIIALANDIAEIFFDLLDFTGVGLAGEAIMEPVNLVLDFFFTGIFVWRVGFGGSTITQYINDLLQLILIPGRTISVFIGMKIANNPDSAISKIATTYTSIESGSVSGAVGKTEGAVGAAEGAAKTERGLQEASTVGVTSEGEAGSEGGAEKTTKEKSPAGGESESSGDENTEKSDENAPENDIFKNPLDNPVGTAGEEAFNPGEDTIQEGEGFGPREESQGEENRPKKVVDIATRRPPAPPKQDQIAA